MALLLCTTIQRHGWVLTKKNEMEDNQSIKQCLEFAIILSHPVSLWKDISPNSGRGLDDIIQSRLGLSIFLWFHSHFELLRQIKQDINQT